MNTQQAITLTIGAATLATPLSAYESQCQLALDDCIASAGSGYLSCMSDANNLLQGIWTAPLYPDAVARCDSNYQIDLALCDFFNGCC